MRFQPIDHYAAQLKGDTRASVYQSTKATHEKRTKLLFDQFADPNRLRAIAGEIKQHAIENLDTLLPQVEAKLKANGAQVHWASTAESACEAVLRIMRARGASKLVKSKTMVSEEIELAHFLERHGRPRLAAELAEARGLPPGRVVRQWFLARDVARAVDLARRTGTFADAASSPFFGFGSSSMTRPSPSTSTGSRCASRRAVNVRAP